MDNIRSIELSIAFYGSFAVGRLLNWHRMPFKIECRVFGTDPVSVCVRSLSQFVERPVKLGKTR